MVVVVLMYYDGGQFMLDDVCWLYARGGGWVMMYCCYCVVGIGLCVSVWICSYGWLWWVIDGERWDVVVCG